jgi:hypothetical protein
MFGCSYCTAITDCFQDDDDNDDDDDDDSLEKFHQQSENGMDVNAAPVAVAIPEGPMLSLTIFVVHSLNFISLQFHPEILVKFKKVCNLDTQ